MYNENLKREYIEDTGVIFGIAKSLFDTTEPFEERYDRDVCAFDKKMMQDLFDNSFGANHSTLRSRQIFFRSYCNWCAEKGLRVTNSINEINLDPKNKYYESMVGDPKTLETRMNHCFNNVCNENVDCLARCYVWCAYMGVPEEKVVLLKNSNIDFKNNIVSLEGKTYQLYKESIPAFKKACELSYFIYQHPMYKNTIIRERFKNEYVFRGIKTPVLTVHGLRTMIRDIFNKRSSFKIRYKHIVFSGIFDRMYQAELQGVTPDFYTIALNNYESKVTDEARRRSSVMQKRKLMTEDYEGWKRAFHSSKE